MLSESSWGIVTHREYLELGDAHALEHAGLEAAPRLARVVEDDAPLEERRERRRAAGEERVAALAVERARLVVDRAGDARVRERAEGLVLAAELGEGAARRQPRIPSRHPWKSI